MKKQLLASILSIVMVLSLLPASVLAETPAMTQEALESAIQGAGSGGTVQLTGDVQLTSALTISKKVTLDLNGYRITQTAENTNAIYLENGADLTVNDSSTNKTGAITGTRNGISNGSSEDVTNIKLTVNGGTITGSGDECSAVYWGYAAITLNGGTYNGTYVNATTITGGTFNNYKSTTVYADTITGGTFDAYVYEIRTISGGTFKRGVFAEEISGGTFEKNSQAVSISSENGVISGGTFNGTVNATKSVTGGTFNGKLSVASGATISNATLNGTLTWKNTGVPTLKNVTIAADFQIDESKSGYYYDSASGTIGQSPTYVLTVHMPAAAEGTVAVTGVKVNNDPMGGSVRPLTADQKVGPIASDTPIEVTLTVEPTDGYEFQGWYSDESGASSLDLTPDTNGAYTYTVTLNGKNEDIYAVFGKTELATAAESWVSGYDGRFDFTISSTDEMAYFAYAVSSLGKTFAGKTVKLDADLDFTNTAYRVVGGRDKPFQGTFNGNQKTISGISGVTGVVGDCVGVFGYLNGAAVQGLTVKNCTFDCSGYNAMAGGIAGDAQNSTITGCTIDGVVTNGWFNGSVVGHTYGGLKVEDTTVTGCTPGAGKGAAVVGYSDGTTITNVTVTDMKAYDSDESYAAALIGHANAGENVIANVSVTAENASLIGTTYSESNGSVTVSGTDGSTITVKNIVNEGTSAKKPVTLESGSYTVSEPTEVTAGSTITLHDGARITVSSGEAFAELAPSAAVKKVSEDDVTTTTTVASGTASGEVDKYGNLILPAGSTVQTGDRFPVTVNNATVVTPNNTIVQGSATENPTVDASGNVTVPSGGVVTDKDGNTTEMVYGGTVTTPEESDDIKVNPAPSNGGSSGGSSSGSSGYTVSVDSGKNGTVTVSPKNASKGTTVTITVKPDKGYELDDLTVTDKNGDSVKLTKKSDTKYTFTMPAGKVEVEASFVKIEEAPEHSFTDVPNGYWAEDAIAWAYEKGYMNGNTAVTFDPEGTVSRQQLWMILARLSGYSPATMAEAKSWAVDNGISDGTFPGGAVSRQQLVTILYRYAQRMGYKTSGSADLTVYPDHASVAAYAKDAMSWSVANSIVGGTTQGTLNPTGTATRAQFAVILSRFCENIVG